MGILTITLALTLLIPVPLGTQAVLAWSGVGAVFVLGALHVRGPVRLAIYAITLLVAGRYIVWRLIHTVPTEGSLGELIPGYLLAGAEVYAFWLLLASIFILLDPIRRPVLTLAGRAETQRPVVDILVPTFDESPDIIEPTLLAMRNLDYPRDRLNILLLDDGSSDARLANDPDGSRKARTEALRTLCQALEVGYHTRPTNANAKAGNLSAGMTHSDGEFIAVFDCDHMPCADFLDKTLPHLLDDPGVWLVQTPHAFLTPDPFDRNMRTEIDTPDENEMFYGSIQQGLDRWDASFFCGSAAVLRRQAVAEAGGFQGRSITEDAETSITMHARGWRSTYVSEPLIAGLQPDTVSNYIGQRQRWLKGMLQIFLWHNPLLKGGLTTPQRISYLAIQTYWFFPIARTIFVLAPLWFLVSGKVFYLATPEEFFAYTLPFLMTIVAYTNAIFGRLRRPLASEIYENALTPYLLPVVLGTLLRPNHSQFNVTAKGEVIDHQYLSPRAKPLLILTALSIIAISYGAWITLNTQQGETAVVLVSGFAGLNLLLMLAGLNAMVETPGRQNRRLTINEPVRWQLTNTSDEPAAGELTQITTDGQAQLATEVERTIEPGQTVVMTSASTSHWLSCRVDQASHDQSAITLALRHQPSDSADKQAWLTLMLGNNEALTQAFVARRHRLTIAMALFEFLLQAVTAPIRLAGVSWRRRTQTPIQRPNPNQPEQEEA